jgi:hypothetical protein
MSEFEWMLTFLITILIYVEYFTLRNNRRIFKILEFERTRKAFIEYDRQKNEPEE